MKIGVIHEAYDLRVALGPDVASLFIQSGNQVIIESGAGKTAFFEDAQYEENGVEVVPTTDDVFKNADILISLQPLPEEVWSKLKSDAIMVSMFQPYVDPSIQEQLTNYGFTAFSMDMIPRTTIAQSMDVLSSMGSIAGYQAVIEAALLLPRYLPMLSSAAGTVAPSKVLVLGAGVAGLQAIATSKRLGGRVNAFDTRAAAKEEVESLGAKFIEVEGARDDKDAGGYGVEQTEEYQLRQRELIAQNAKECDVIICTAQVRGPKAPLLITKEIVEGMKPGSVIIDLAASTGGNCELTKNNETIRYNNVTILGDSNLASKVSLNATQMFGKNVFNFLSTMIKEGEFQPDWENVIIKDSCIFSPDLPTAKQA